MYGAIPASPISLQAVVSNEAKGVLIFQRFKLLVGEVKRCCCGTVAADQHALYYCRQPSYSLFNVQLIWTVATLLQSAVLWHYRCN
jgi:hypothetical protein